MELCLAVSPGELTRAEQKILDYINTNTDAFLFSSIGQLSQRLGLSDATVSRFARHAGCLPFIIPVIGRTFQVIMVARDQHDLCMCQSGK